MLLPLLTVGLALLCGLQAMEMSHEGSQMDLKELSGEWYAAAIASNNSALIRPGGHFRVFIEDICVIDGNLHGKILVPGEQGCRKEYVTAVKTPRKNRFTVIYWGFNDMHLVKVKPKNYLIYSIINHYEGVTSMVNYLIVRDPITKPNILKEFKSVCEHLGLHKNQIVVLGPKNRCESFRD